MDHPIYMYDYSILQNPLFQSEYVTQMEGTPYCQAQNLSGWQNYWEPQKNFSHTFSLRRKNNHENYETLETFDGTNPMRNYANVGRNFEPQPHYQTNNHYSPQVGQGPYVRGDVPTFFRGPYSRGSGYRRRGNSAFYNTQPNTQYRTNFKSNEYISQQCCSTACDQDSTQTFKTSNEEAIDLNCDIISENNNLVEEKETTPVSNNLVCINIEDSDGDTVCLDEMDHIVPTTLTGDEDNKHLKSKEEELQNKEREIENPPGEDNKKDNCVNTDILPFLENRLSDSISENDSNIKKKTCEKHSSFVVVERQKDSLDPRLNVDIERNTERTILLGMLKWEKELKKTEDKSNKQLEQIEELDVSPTPVTETTPEKAHNSKDPRAWSEFYNKEQNKNEYLSKETLKYKVKKKINPKLVSMSIKTKENYQKLKTVADRKIIRKRTTEIHQINKKKVMIKDKNVIIRRDESVIRRHHKGPVSKYSCFVPLPRIDQYSHLIKNNSVRLNNNESTCNNETDDNFDLLGNIDTKQSYLLLMDKEKKQPESKNTETNSNSKLFKKPDDKNRRNMVAKSECHRSNGQSPKSNVAEVSKVPPDEPTAKDSAPKQAAIIRRQENSIERCFFQRYDGGKKTPTPMKQKKKPNTPQPAEISDKIDKNIHFVQKTDVKKKLYDVCFDSFHDLDRLGRVPSRVVAVSKDRKCKSENVRQKQLTDLFGDDLSDLTTGEPSTKGAKRRMSCEDPKIIPGKIRRRRRTLACTICLDQHDTNEGEHREHKGEHSSLDHEIEGFSPLEESPILRDLTGNRSPNAEQPVVKPPNKTTTASESPAVTNKSGLNQDQYSTSNSTATSLNISERCESSFRSASVEKSKDSNGLNVKKNQYSLSTVTNVQSPRGAKVQILDETLKRPQLHKPSDSNKKKKYSEDITSQAIAVETLNRKELKICDPSLLCAISEQDSTGKCAAVNKKQIEICDPFLLSATPEQSSNEKCTSINRKQMNICDPSLLSVIPDQNSPQKYTEKQKTSIDSKEEKPVKMVNKRREDNASEIKTQKINLEEYLRKYAKQNQPTVGINGKEQPNKTNKPCEDNANQKIKIIENKRLHNEENLIKVSDVPTVISEEKKRSNKINEACEDNVTLKMKVVYTQKFKREQELLTKHSEPDEISADSKEKKKGDKTKATETQKLKTEECPARKYAKKGRPTVDSNEKKESEKTQKPCEDSVNLEMKTAEAQKLLTEQDHTRKHAEQEVLTKDSDKKEKCVPTKRNSGEVANESIKIVETDSEGHRNVDKEQVQLNKNNTDIESIETITQEILLGGTSLNVIHIEETETRPDSSCDDIFKILNDSSITLVDNETEKTKPINETSNKKNNAKTHTTVNEINNNNVNSTFYALPETLPENNLEVANNFKVRCREYQRATSKVILFEELSELNDFKMSRAKIVNPYIDLTAEEEDCGNLCNVLITNVSTEVSIQCIKSEESDVVKVAIESEERDVTIGKETLALKEAVVSKEENALDEVAEMTHQDRAIPVSADQTIVKDSLQNVSSYCPTVSVAKNLIHICGNLEPQSTNQNSSGSMPTQPPPDSFHSFTEKELLDITDLFYHEVFEILKAYSFLKRRYESTLTSVEQILQMQPNHYIVMNNEKETISKIIHSKRNTYCYYLSILVNRIPSHIARHVFTMYMKKLCNHQKHDLIKIISILYDFVDNPSWPICNQGSFPQFRTMIQSYQKEILRLTTVPIMTEKQILATKHQIEKYLELTRNLTPCPNLTSPTHQQCSGKAGAKIASQFTSPQPPPYLSILNHQPPASKSPQSHTPSHPQQATRKSPSQPQRLSVLYPPSQFIATRKTPENVPTFISAIPHTTASNRNQSPPGLSQVRHGPGKVPDPSQYPLSARHANDRNKSFQTQDRLMDATQATGTMRGPPNVTITRNEINNLEMAVNKMLFTCVPGQTNQTVANSSSVSRMQKISHAQVSQASSTKEIVEQPRPSDTARSSEPEVPRPPVENTIGRNWWPEPPRIPGINAENERCTSQDVVETPAVSEAQTQNMPAVAQSKHVEILNPTIVPDTQTKGGGISSDNVDGVHIIDLTEMDTDDAPTDDAVNYRCVISTGEIVDLMITDSIVKNEETEEAADEVPNKVTSTSNEKSVAVSDGSHPNDLEEDVKSDLIKYFNVKDEDKHQSAADEIIDLTWLDDIPLKQELTGDVAVVENDKERTEQISSRNILENRQCFCGKNAEYLCYCKTVMYCSQQCQIQHWGQHQKTCSSTTYLRS